ncbi:hypothetical protein EDC04DRAFT_1225362 [Pisolithus marmoratus]|nr:hypothetical protein EDC04DRAFT_1225362 [Pisolithus marmoratus]
MFTNDMTIALANGACKVEEIDEGTDPDGYHIYRIFRDVLTTFSIDLPKLVVKDGEGATRFVEVSVEKEYSIVRRHALRRFDRLYTRTCQNDFTAKMPRKY